MPTVDGSNQTLSVTTSTKQPIEIPDKVFFRIGEVARITGVKAYVLRYWETEFPGLKPQKSASGQRRYRRGDVEFVLQLRELLWERGFTIKGARTHLRSEAKAKRERGAGDAVDSLSEGGMGPGSAAAARSPEAVHPDLQRRLSTQTKDLNTARRSLTQMRSEIANFLNDLDG